MADEKIEVAFGATTKELEVAAKTSRAAVEDFSNGVKASAEGAEKAITRTGHATAGTTRELIVLAHEVVSGNFSRIPGSLMVLAERSGNLTNMVTALASAFMNPLVMGVTAATVAFSIFEHQSSKIERENELIGNSFTAVGRGMELNSSQIQNNIKYLKQFHDVTNDEAVEAQNNLARAMDLTQEKSQRIIAILPKLAILLGTDVSKAADIMAQSMNNPAKAIEELDKKFNLLSDHQLMLFQEMSKSGDKYGEQTLLIDVLADRVTNITSKLSWWERGVRGQVAAWDALGDAIKKVVKDTPELFTGSPSIDPVKFGPEITQNVQRQIDLNRQNNIQIKEGVKLADQVIDRYKKETTLIGERNNLEAQKKEADRSGDTAGSAKMSAAISALNQKITQDEKREEDIRLKNHRDLQTAKLAGEKQYAEEMNSLQTERVRMEFDEGKISSKQQMQMLLNLKNQQYQAELSALTKEEALWHRGSAEWQKIENEKTKIKMKAELDRQKIIDQEINAEKQKWQTLFSSFNSGIMGMLKGTMTFKQGLISIVDGITGVWLNQIEESAAKWISSEFTKTSATVAGNTARTASTISAAAVGKTVQAASATTSIGSAAAQGAASTYASIAAIPIVGPFLAPPAAAAAFLAIGAFKSMLPSFDVGTNYVPNDMLAQIHKGERIIPAADNAKLMENAAGGGGGDIHFHGPVYGMRDFEAHVVKAMTSAKRNFNPALSGALK